MSDYRAGEKGPTFIYGPQEGNKLKEGYGKKSLRNSALNNIFSVMKQTSSGENVVLSVLKS